MKLGASILQTQPLGVVHATPVVRRPSGSYDTDGESGTVTWSGPPCNLSLAPQSSIRLLLVDRPLWTTHPPRNLIGLFSPTWQPR